MKSVADGPRPCQTGLPLSGPCYPRWVKPLAAIAVLALALALAACGGDSDEFAATPTAPAETPAVQPTDVTFETSDGVAIAGSLWRVDSPAIVVFAHMRGSNRDGWRPVAERVAADLGVAALTFDFRGHGDSDDGELGEIDLDLEAAVAFARAEGYERVIVAGASMGGTAAIAVAAREDLAGVIAVSSPAEFEGIDAAAAIGGVTEPALFIAAQGDQPYRHDVEELHDAASGPKDILLLPGNDHGTRLLGRNDAERFVAAILDFVREHR